MTCMPGEGSTGPVQVVLTVVPRRELAAIKAIMQGFDPDLFYCVDGLNSSSAGVTPAPRRGLPAVLPLLHDFRRREPAAARARAA